MNRGGPLTRNKMTVDALATDNTLVGAPDPENTAQMALMLTVVLANDGKLSESEGERRPQATRRKPLSGAQRLWVAALSLTPLPLVEAVKAVLRTRS